MKYLIDHDYHIHSYLSQCSGAPEQTPLGILEKAKELGLKRIALTDHFWDESVPGASEWYKTYHKLSDISKALPLPRDGEVEFLFGCETDMDKNGVIGLSRDKFDTFDFIIVSTTHLHMKGFTVSEDDYPDTDRLAELWVQRFDALLGSELPFGKVGVAHLTSICIGVENDRFVEVIGKIPEEEMRRLFTRAAALGLGIELNTSDFFNRAQYFDAMLRPFVIAKECGCKFYFGSDAHKPRGFNTYGICQRVIDALELQEEDKFHIAR